MSETKAPIEPRDSPYLGLDYYEERFGEWFFGRETEGGKISTNLRAARLTLLHAESGVGKSSLLNAGVAWRMRRLADDSLARRGTARSVPIVFSSWKDDPVLELTSAIRSAIGPYLAGRPEPELPTDRLDAAIGAASGAVNASLLIMLDQFEEYFLYRSREPTPERFADELARCINRADLRANFLIAIREDAYAGLGDLFKGRIANVYSNYLHVEYLDRASAEKAIREPLDIYNSQPEVSEHVKIQDELVGAVLDQVRAFDGAGDAAQGRAAAAYGGGGDRVATPLLQLVMETVWERERAAGSHELRLSTLHDLRGVKMIVDAHLGKALSALGSGERQTAIDMFDHLVTPSGGKIAESVPDLAQRTGHSEDQVSSVLEKLDHERIVRPIPAAPGQDPMRYRRYEIFHDVLAPTINRAIAAREERRRARRLRRFAALAVCLLIVALAVGGTFASLSHTATIAASNADHQRNLAVSAEVAAESEALAFQEPLPASLLAVAAWRIAPTAEARVSLLNVLAQPDHGVPLVGRQPASAVAFSPDGKTLATASATRSSKPGSARLWGVATRQQEGVLRTPKTGEVTAVAFSPADGRILATAGVDGSARLWNADTYRQIRRFQSGQPTRLTAVAFSPDGKTLATADADGFAHLWDVATGQQVGTLRASRTGAVNAVAFSPGGKTLATVGADGTARLWSADTHRQIHRFRSGHPTPLKAVAFSPGGKTLATAGADGTARLWDVATGQQTGTLRASRTGAVNAVAFSPGGKTLATAGADGTARLWDLATNRQIGTPLVVGTGAMNAVAFSPDGKSLATAGVDGTARLWDVTVYRQMGAPLAAEAGAVNAVAFSPDGKSLATADVDSTARLWDLATGQQTGTLRASRTGAVNAVAFSPGGKTLATAGADGTARLWDLATNRQIGTPLVVGTGAMNAVVFSPDGKTLATAGADGTARLWDVATHREKGAPLAAGAKSGAMYAVAFSPDGKTLATAGADAFARLWNVATHREVGASDPSNLGFKSVAFSPNGKILATAGNNKIRLWIVRRHLRQIGTPLASGNEAMRAVAFSPDSKTIATASDDGTARLWDVATHQQVGPALIASRGGVNDVAFRPDGKVLVTASGDGTAQLWNIALPKDKYLANAACAISGRSLKRNEWTAHIKSLPFRQVCPR